jgi:alginate O-acetyltransferase complex protein AlgI
VLGYFKYANFLVAQGNVLLRWTGALPIDIAPVALPVGISFYTFHSLSYIIDVYRKTTPAFTNPLDYALYVSLFPQLIAGPIIRFKQIAPQIRERVPRVEQIGEGAVRFCFGLSKKVLVADPIGEVVHAVFAVPAHQLDTGTAWIGAAAYTFQLYFDFSGYSDMAIGLGRMFGFQFPENFWRPYSAVSITDFWRRWHMTLSAWFRDYLYVPLGGSRVGAWRTYFNLGLVFLATGLWHGANWTFVIWGAYHGALLICERVTGQRATDETVSHIPLRRAAVFALVLLGWVVFRSDSVEHAASFYSSMFAFESAPAVTAVQASMTTRNTVMLLLAPLVVLLPRHFSMGVWLVQGGSRVAAVARVFVLLILFPLSVLGMVSSGFHPFLYFRF